MKWRFEPSDQFLLHKILIEEELLAYPEPELVLRARPCTVILPRLSETLKIKQYWQNEEKHIEQEHKKFFFTQYHILKKNRTQENE